MFLLKTPALLFQGLLGPDRVGVNITKSVLPSLSLLFLTKKISISCRLLDAGVKMTIFFLHSSS